MLVESWSEGGFYDGVFVLILNRGARNERKRKENDKNNKT
jgi:hypothetical protein